jgi:hypothetical protein
LVVVRWHSSGSEVRLSLPVGLWKKKTQKLAVHACACAHDGGEKGNVLIVRVLLPIAVNFALCSKTHPQDLDAPLHRGKTVLVHVA